MAKSPARPAVKGSKSSPLPLGEGRGDGLGVKSPLPTPKNILEAAAVAAALWAKLSPRETQVLHLFLQNRSDKQISSQLKIHAQTARSHLASIERKLGASTRVALALLLGPDRGDVHS